MSAPESNLPSDSIRPYLIRALYEWCADNGLTPYITVLVDETVRVPHEYVQGGQIVLNISADATSALALDNDYIRFKARFGGVPREIIIPINHVMAIYARENGQGMAFNVLEPTLGDDATASAEDTASNPYSAASAGRSSVTHNPYAVRSGSRSGIRLVSTTPAAPNSGDDDEPPPTTTPPTSPRPTLKRVK